MPLIFIILTIFVLSALAFSMRDCYRRRGPRLAFNFFFFAFLYILGWIWRDISPGLLSLTPAGGSVYVDKMLHPAAHPRSIAIFTFFIAVITVSGWMFLFYIGWFLTEKILQRFDVLKRRLFLTLFFSLLVISAILYPVVRIINIVDWQKWQIPVMPNDIFLIGYPAKPFLEGFYFSAYFLAAYFLMECSKFRHRDWKMIFFLLPFIHLWITRLFGTGSAIFFERMVVFVTIVMLAFFSRLKLIDMKFQERE